MVSPRRRSLKFTVPPVRLIWSSRTRERTSLLMRSAEGVKIQLPSPVASRSSITVGCSTSMLSTSIPPCSSPASVMRTVMRSAVANCGPASPGGLAIMILSAVSRGHGKSLAEIGPSIVTARPVSFLP